MKGGRPLKRLRILIALSVSVLLLRSSFAWQVGEPAVHLLTFSADGTRVAVGYRSGVTLYDTATGGTVIRFPPTEHDVTAFALAPDNRLLATGDGSGTIRLSDTRTGEQSAVLRNPNATPIVALAFSPTGHMLASGGFRETYLWDLTQPLTALPRVLRGHRDMVTTLAFSPDSQTLASAGFHGTILVWDVETARLRHNLSTDTDSVLSLTFSPDNQALVSGGYWNPEVESTLQVWDAVTGDLLTRFANHTAPVFALAFVGTHDLTLASAGWGPAIRTWDLRTGELESIFETGSESVATFTHLPDATLASATFEGSVHLHRSQTATPQNLWDVNADGAVNLLDLIFVASRFGTQSPDFNADGIVNVLDLVLVANQIGK